MTSVQGSSSSLHSAGDSHSSSQQPLSYSRCKHQSLTIIRFLFQLTTYRESSFNPEIGIESCFVDDHVAYRQLIFFHLPIFLLLLVNLAGFIYCIVHIWKNNAGNSRRGRTEEGNSSVLAKMRINKEARDQLVGNTDMSSSDTYLFRLFTRNSL